MRVLLAFLMVLTSWPLQSASHTQENWNPSFATPLEVQALIPAQLFARIPLLQRHIKAREQARIAAPHAQPGLLFDRYSDNAIRQALQAQHAESRTLLQAELQGRTMADLTIEERDALYMKLPTAYDWAEERQAGVMEMKAVGPFEAQFNKRRAARAGSPDRKPVAGKPPFNRFHFSFPGRVPVLGRDRWAGQVWTFIGNKFQFAPDHFQMIAADDRPQFLTMTDIRGGLQLLARSADSSLRVIFNGWGASSSINHLHLQAFYHDTPLPIEQFEGPEFARIGPVTLRSPRAGWPGRAVFLASSENDALAVVASRLIDRLQSVGIAHNVLFRKSNIGDSSPVYQMVVFPRSAKGEVASEIPVGFATMEMSGHIILTKAETYTDLTEAKIRHALDEMSLPTEALSGILRATLDDFKAGQPTDIERIAQAQTEAAQLHAAVYQQLSEDTLPSSSQNISNALFVHRRLMDWQLRGWPITATDPSMGVEVSWAHQDPSKDGQAYQRRIERAVHRFTRHSPTLSVSLLGLSVIVVAGSLWAAKVPLGQEWMSVASILIGSILMVKVPEDNPYTQALRRELVELRRRNEISPELYYQTLQEIQNAGNLRTVYWAWRYAYKQETRAEFRKFVRFFVDRLAPSYVEFVPVLTRLTYKLAKIGRGSKPLFDVLMGALGKGYPYRRRLEEQYRELTSRRANQPIRLVYVTPEVLPHSKKGGLAEVAGELPRAMNQLNAWVTTISLTYASTHMLPANRHPRLPLFMNGRPVEIPIRLTNERGQDEIHLARVTRSGLHAAWAGEPEMYFLEDVTPSNPSKGLENLTVTPYPDTAVLKAKQARFLAEGSLQLLKILIGSKELSRPDFVVGHDWPASLVNVYLRTRYRDDPQLGGILPGFYLHNNFRAYQGILPKEVWMLLGLSGEHRHGFDYETAWLRPDGTIALEGQHPYLNLVAAAVFHASIVIPVSPVYAEMIQMPAFGEGLDTIFRAKASLGVLRGISNGMTYDPRDKLIQSAADAEHFYETKRFAKRALLEETGLWAAIQREIDERLPRSAFDSESAYLEARAEALAREFARPVEVVLTRLDLYQKGLGFYQDQQYGVEAMMQRPRERQSRLIIMGSPARKDSDPPTDFEVYMARMEARYPASVRFIPQFTMPLKDMDRAKGLFVSRPITSLEHLIWLGGDFASMPSRMEPFGLTGLEALSAGTPLIGSTQGGPGVMVQDIRIAGEQANGILFGQAFDLLPDALRGQLAPYTAQGFWDAREQLLDLYFLDTQRWRQIMLNAKNTRMTWDQSARTQLQYLAGLLGRHDIVENPDKPIRIRQSAPLPNIQEKQELPVIVPQNGRADAPVPGIESESGRGVIEVVVIMAGALFAVLFGRHLNSGATTALFAAAA